MMVSTNGLNSLNADKHSPRLLRMSTLLVETSVNKEFEWENLYT